MPKLNDPLCRSFKYSRNLILPRLAKTAVFVALLIAGLAVSAGDLRAGAYSLENKNADIAFTYTVGFIEQMGRFKEIDGLLRFDKRAPQNGSISAVIKTASLSANAFEGELKGRDFFNVAAYPEIRFVSASVKPLGENSAEFNGTLTMRGVSKPVTLRFDFAPQPGAPGQMTMTVRGRLKRSEFNMTALSLLVDDEIEIVIKSALREKK
jgi:polyisoprenoid-binding protein YceI